MARIPPLPQNAYPWYLKLLFYFQKKKYGAPLEPVLLWGRTPRVFLSFLLMQKALNRKKSPLSPLLRALVTVKVSEINACSFCVDMNSALVMQRGGSSDKMLQIARFKESSLFNDLEKTALEYAEAMTQSSNKIPEALFEKLKKHFDDYAIIELTALISFQNLSSKFNAALDIAAYGFCQPSHKK